MPSFPGSCLLQFSSYMLPLIFPCDRLPFLHETKLADELLNDITFLIGCLMLIECDAQINAHNITSSWRQEWK